MVLECKEHFRLAMSVNGGFSRAQLKVLGIPRFKKGWKARAMRHDYPTETIEKFIALKDVHLAAKFALNPDKLDEEFQRATQGI